ncbi:LysR substrate-binding domain-containing protein [Mycobacterium sp. NPDC003449]
MVVSLTQLEVLVAVVESGGFSGAAKQLFMSQPSVSNHIRNLESSLGVQLVQRSTQGARTTPAGDIAVDHAREVFQLLTSLERQVAGLQGLEAGRLVVAGTTTLGTYLLPRLVAEFAEQAPKVECQIRVGNEDTVENWVLRGEVALGLCAETPREEQLLAHPLFEEEMVLVAAAGTSLARQSLRAEDLASQRFLMREMGSATRRQQEAALRLWGLDTAEQWDLWGPDTLKEAVHAGLGLALLSDHSTARERSSGVLVALSVEPPPPSRTVYLLRRADRVLTPPEQAFVRLVDGISAWPS